MELNLDQKLRLLLTPQMQQSMQMLQMNNLDLAEYILGLALENPAMEIEMSKDQEEQRPDTLLDRLQWLDSTDENNRDESMNDTQSEDGKGFEMPSPQGETLSECLHLQLLAFNLSEKQQRIAVTIIENLDENGYLVETAEDIADTLHVKIEAVERMLHMIQRLEPIGVGARSLRECLSIQLQAMGATDCAAYRIVQNHLDDLSQNKITRIAENLNMTIEEVAEARLIILSLDPKPGKSFSLSPPQYVCADVIVEKLEGRHVPFINDNRVPTIRLSSYYRRLVNRTNDSEVREYLSTKFRQANWIIKCIEQRNRTILLSTNTLIALQKKFFDQGPACLAPMTLSDIAESIGMHVSTVSRAFKGKYLQCSWGLFPFGYFLAPGISSKGNDPTSPQMVKSMISALIASENKKRPKSDEEIAAYLMEKGVNISRRTIAKYRGELNIPSSIRRKEY